MDFPKIIYSKDVLEFNIDYFILLKFVIYIYIHYKMLI